MPQVNQTPTRRDDLVVMLRHGGARTDETAEYVVNAFAYELVQRVQSALLQTTDGTEVDDSFEIPAGEIRRILADVRIGGES